jgi:hypothetical protein
MFMTVFPIMKMLFIHTVDRCSRDRSVGIATGYGLGGLGSIPHSARFLSSSQRPD